MATPETDTDTDDDLALAIGRYALGGISEGRAAEIAGVSRWRMREILEAAGVDLRHGPRNDEELRRDVDVAMSLGEDGHNGDE